MKRSSVQLLLLLGLILQIWDAHSSIEERLKEDFFAIYTHTALAVRDVQEGQVTPDQVTFYLFTNSNPENYIILDPSNPEELDSNVPIVVLIHGWTESREKQWYEDLKNAFLLKYPTSNVIQVDWREPADQIYTVSSYNTKDVGEIIGKYIVDWSVNSSIPLENFLIVGHSLGGQVAGYTGRTVQNLTNQKLPRIIALDAAGPLFMNRPDDERLNKFDATVVECLHTDGGTFGYLGSCGTIDFYPNGGSTQPGCVSLDLLVVTAVTQAVLCDHFRSWAYFTEAILNPENFVATKCTSWSRFLLGGCRGGETVSLGDLETTKTGSFYFQTNRQSPYGRG